MSIETNKAVAVEYIRRFAEGRIDYAHELLSDDVSWEIFGDLPFSGLHAKKELRKISQGVVDFFVSFPQWIVDGVTAEDDKVAVEAHSIGHTPHGFVYRNRYHLLFEVRDSRIVWAKEYMDTKHCWDLINSSAEAAPRAAAAIQAE